MSFLFNSEEAVAILVSHVLRLLRQIRERKLADLIVATAPSAHQEGLPVSLVTLLFVLVRCGIATRFGTWLCAESYVLLVTGF